MTGGGETKIVISIRSIYSLLLTIAQLEMVDEEDEETAVEHEDRRRSSHEAGRLGTPEPFPCSIWRL